MEKHMPPSETRYDDLNGTASLKLTENFESLAQNIANVDTNRYQPVAIRAYFSNDDLVITIFAKDRNEPASTTGKTKVTKFKVQASPFEFLQAILQMDCTLVTEGVRVEDFEVIN